MKMKNIKILTTLLCMLLAMGYAQETHGSDVTTTFSADLSYTSRNPLQGWVIYAGLGDGLADNFWSQYDKMQSSEGTVKVSDYATTLFIRAAWTYFNPEEDVYAWQPTCNTKPAQRLRMLMEGAKTRNLRLAFSFITDSRDKHDNFTPQYVRDAGAKGFESTTGSFQVWSPYPDDPVFQQKYEKFLTAFAETFNDPDLVQFISGTGLGKWGEGHSVKYSTGNTNPRAAVFDWITSLNARLFTRVPIIINYHRWILSNKEWDGTNYDPNSSKLLDEAVEKGFSLRHDAFGMKTYYSTWEKQYVARHIFERPVLAEGGWVKSSHGNSPMKQDGYKDYADVRLGEFTQASEAHVNMMDLRYNSDISVGETYSWFNDAFPLVRRFIQEGGYHLYPKTVTTPGQVEGNTATVSSLWANTGWGYCPTNIPQWNQKYKVAYALLRGDEAIATFVDYDSDLSKLTKDNDQPSSKEISLEGVPAGIYTWAIGLVDITKDNIIGLDVSVANDLKMSGWVRLNTITVGTPPATCDYYVSPEGAGTRDGSSFANAWGIDQLMTKLNATNAATFNDGDNIYFAGGKYVATATLYVKTGLNLIGAAEGERTLFSGDANGDGEVNEGDRDRVFQINTAVGVGTTEKCVNISNIDFDGLFIAQGGNDTKGALYLDNCGALVTVSNCHFTRLINSGQGANALFSKRSSVKFVDCTFTGNKAANRGIVARLQGDTKKGFTTFERCLFANNEATGAEGDPCGMVMMQHGQQMNFVNCTFANNKSNGKGGAIWNGTAPDGTYPRVLNVISCTFAGNEAVEGSAIFLNAASTANVVNSIVVGEINMPDAVKVNESNLLGKSYEEVFGTNMLENGVITPIAYNKTTVDLAETVAPLELSAEVDLTKDQTGAVRKVNAIGAYDVKPESSDVTSIAGIQPKEASLPAYNLSGQRVASPVKGIFIIGGKKVVK